MSVYSVGKNEVHSLMEKEQRIKQELEEITKASSTGNICSFRSLILKNEIKKVHNKLKILSFGSGPDGDDIA